MDGEEHTPSPKVQQQLKVAVPSSIPSSEFAMRSDSERKRVRRMGEPVAHKPHLRAGLVGAGAARALLAVWRPRGPASPPAIPLSKEQAEACRLLEAEETVYRAALLSLAEAALGSGSLAVVRAELRARLTVERKWHASWAKLEAKMELLTNAMCNTARWYQAWNGWTEKCRLIQAEESTTRQTQVANYDREAARFAVQASELGARAHRVYSANQTMVHILTNAQRLLRYWVEREAVSRKLEDDLQKAHLWSFNAAVTTITLKAREAEARYSLMADSDARMKFIVRDADAQCRQYQAFAGQRRASAAAEALQRQRLTAECSAAAAQMKLIAGEMGARACLDTSRTEFIETLTQGMSHRLRQWRKLSAATGHLEAIEATQRQAHFYRWDHSVAQFTLQLNEANTRVGFGNASDQKILGLFGTAADTFAAQLHSEAVRRELEAEELIFRRALQYTAGAIQESGRLGTLKSELQSRFDMEREWLMGWQTLHEQMQMERRRRQRFSATWFAAKLLPFHGSAVTVRRGH